jgi:hypothetical protein
MADLRNYSISKAASVCLLDSLRKGLVGKDTVFRALQGLADELGQPGESSAQRFAKAFASGANNRVPGGNALLVESNKLGTGDLPFRFTPQTGDESPAESVRRVTVKPDDTARSSAGDFTSQGRIISPNATALDSWQDAIREIMEVQGVNETKAVNIAMQDPSLREKWNAAKSMKFSPLLTKAAPPSGDHLDDDDDDDDDEDDCENGKSKPKVAKSLLAMAMARQRQRGSGGGVPR